MFLSHVWMGFHYVLWFPPSHKDDAMQKHAQEVNGIAQWLPNAPEGLPLVASKYGSNAEDKFIAHTRTVKFTLTFTRCLECSISTGQLTEHYSVQNFQYNYYGQT